MKNIKILVLVLISILTFSYASADYWETASDSVTVVVTAASTYYNLTVNKAGTGTGTVGGAGSYLSGTSASASASPSSGSTFSGWSGDCNSSGQVTMNSNKSCTATFTLNVVNCVGAWNGCVSGTNTYYISQYASGGGTACPYANGATKSCSDCVGGWTSCSSSGSQIYMISFNATGGGTACPYAAGTTRSCTPPVSTSGYISSYGCSIPAGSSGCSTSASWSISNPVGSSAVTYSGGTLSTSSSGSGSSYTPRGSRTYYLYNNGSLLDSSSSWADCTSGTTWNGSTCVATSVMSGWISSTNCTITSGSTCNTNLSWSTSNPEATSGVTTPTSITVANGNSGSTSYPVTSSSRTFYLYNNGTYLGQTTPSVSISCGGGTSWNGSSCAASNVSPTANAGSDINITLPVSSVIVSGASVSDSDGTASPSWSFVSGPGAIPSISGGSTLTPTFSNLTLAGTYIFRLTATDNLGATSSDTINVIVGAAAPSPTISSFSADKYSIDFGKAVVLTWSSTSATSCSITATATSVVTTGLSSSGNKSFKPTKTTNYTLKCTGPGGNDTKTLPNPVVVGKINPNYQEY